MNKTQIKVDNDIFDVDDIDWEYSLQESDTSGRSDDGSMHHDVVGMLTKVYCDFKDFRGEEEISKLLNLLEKTDCQLTYYDLKEKTFLTKSMYVSGDAISIKFINNEFLAEPFQLRFTSNKVD